jgi:hypothetical protein
MGAEVRRMADDNVDKALTPEQCTRLLGHLMLAWDGQWFLKVAESCGLEKAVELNARVRNSFGRIEIRDFMKAKGIERAGSLDEAAKLLSEYGSIFLGEGMSAEWSIDDGAATIKVTRCRPQEGAGRAGLRPDTPCVACETIWATWLGVVLPGTKWSTEVLQSMGRGAGLCVITVRPVENKT